MSDNAAILVVDDDQDVLTACRLVLARRFARIDTCTDPQQIPELLSANRYAAILLDMNFGPSESSGDQGLYWLEKILAHDRDAVVVLITAHGDVGMAVETMKRGATDFITKPWQNEKLIATVSAAVKLRESREETTRLKQTNTALAEASGSGTPMIGDSPAMQDVQNLISRCAPTDANVLILGENGTGKELAARAIHQQSLRSDAVFMKVDLGAVAESLFESELFGHVKGAFTDAKNDRIGRLQAASGGTLFLDEIGNVPLHLQAKLLTVLAQRQLTPLGATKTVDIDVRIIAATNVPREELRDENRFRQDLLFRLNTVEIEMPPLRARAGDIPQIAQFYADHFARKYNQPDRSFSADALQALVSYPWPGNVRALSHALERAVILADGAEFQVRDFDLPGNEAPPAASVTTELNLDRLEREAVRTALVQHRYNISQAAKTLGLTRAALYRRMEKHGL